jgi:hypothetical protein
MGRGAQELRSPGVEEAPFCGAHQALLGLSWTIAPNQDQIKG